MKNRFPEAAKFIGKSLVWATLLYAALMLAINWEDVRAAAGTGSPKPQVVATQAVVPQFPNTGSVSPAARNI